MSGRNVRRYFRKSMFSRVADYTSARVHDSPLWHSVAKSVPPAVEKHVHPSSVPKLEYEEDRLVRRYAKRHPEVFFEKMDILNYNERDSVAMRFAKKQLKLMKEDGLSEEEAYDVVQERFDAERAVLEESLGASHPKVLLHGMDSSKALYRLHKVEHFMGRHEVARWQKYWNDWLDKGVWSAEEAAADASLDRPWKEVDLDAASGGGGSGSSSSSSSA
eukprot:PLAT1629.2.p2 GENE.PLAT1629.2~~PLAT1629.2.p2  ORF type:complete len:218 (+),score=85.29 PLAT1629.2:230-883(+)